MGEDSLLERVTATAENLETNFLHGKNPTLVSPAAI